MVTNTRTQRSVSPHIGPIATADGLGFVLRMTRLTYPRLCCVRGGAAKRRSRFIRPAAPAEAQTTTASPATSTTSQPSTEVHNKPHRHSPLTTAKHIKHAGALGTRALGKHRALGLGTAPLRPQQHVLQHQRTRRARTHDRNDAWKANSIELNQ